MREHGYKSSKYRKEVSRKCCILVFSKKRIPPHLSLTAIDGVSCSIIMKQAKENIAITPDSKKGE